MSDRKDNKDDQPEFPWMITQPDKIGESLAPQLGTDTKDIEKGGWDMRRLSFLNQDEITCLMYGMVRGTKSRAWRTLVNAKLNLNVSDTGIGRRQIIQMEGASRAVPQNIEAGIDKPGWFTRNVANRDWREDERKRLGI